ncbi:DinB family protein [Hymenobacter sp. DH14]|uniref:DinB family protein n=1 Tax=Hymenobacter cyanobacteriorum TaxID=2926463 RepID=A0A9X1VM95_9BACT|nr:DinB family protein [Hymenobacter cyanobacteriorum]MCI1189620.1 DinB family protein [Hymenobacter cyanobacteriorum]
MPEITRLLDQLRRAFDGEPWSGPSLLDTLKDLTAAQAARQPIANAHSIWEITCHAGVWAEVARRRLVEGSLVQVSDAEDWPSPPENPTEADWQAVLAGLRTAHEQLLAAAATVSDETLDRPINTTIDAQVGYGSSIYVTLHGVAQHYLYHTGQIALLRKAVT